MATDFEAGMLPIGQIIKTVGYKGALVVEPDVAFINNWNNLQKCIISVSGIWAPFFVESINEVGSDLHVKFKDLQSDQEARAVCGENIYVFESDLIAENNLETIEADDSWIGFELHDSELGLIGEIDAIEEFPGHDMIYVIYQNRSIAVPLVEDLIIDVDLEKKSVLMNLPHGILEL